MKLAIFLTLGLVFNAFAKANAQKITLNVKNTPLREVMREIQKQKGYSFLFRGDDIADVRVDAQLKQVEFSDAMDMILANRGLGWTLVEGIVTITGRHDATPKVSEAERQQRLVTGKITDEHGNPLDGVTILLKGTRQATTSNADGSYQLAFVGDFDVLVFSIVGFESTEVLITGREVVNVSLLAAVSDIDEVVVVGYGTQRKATLTGSQSTVEMAAIRNNPVGNVTQALQGAVSGATVANANTPGGDAQIRIRGMGTINNNNPLWVIDGVPRTGGLNQLSSSEIESITVLKDASATAIYGARGANGVILVSTLQGKKSQAPSINFNIRTGVSQNTQHYDMLNVEEYAEMLWLQFKNSGIAPSHPIFGNGDQPKMPKYLLPAGADEVDLNLYDRASFQITEANLEGTDWYNEIFNSAPMYEANLSVTGGADRTTYGFGVGVLKEDGLVKYTGFERYNFRSNSSFNVTDWLTLGENLGISYTNRFGDLTDSGEGSAIGQLLDVSAIMPIYDVMGNWAPLTRLTGIQANLFHPLAELDYKKDFTRKDLALTGNVYAQMKLIKGLQLKSLFGLNYGNSHDKSPLEANPESYVARPYPELSELYGQSNTWNWTNTLDYETRLADHHRLSILLGTEALSSKSEDLGASRNQFFSTTEDYFVMSAGEGNIQNSGSMSDWTTFSVFGRVNYDIADKYLFSATVRRDGSSRFGKNNRYGTFPAFSAGWIVSDEPFLSDRGQWLSFLKLRASWGKSGNDQVGNYNGFNTFNQVRDLSYYPLAGSNSGLSTGFQSAAFGNPNAKWETTTTTNLGVDAIFLNRLDVTVDFWQRNTSEMLYRLSVPYVYGQATIPSSNVGNMKNRGVDLDLSYRSRPADNGLKYTLTLTLSAYKNEIVSLSPNKAEAIVGSTIRDQVYLRSEQGTSFPQFFGYQAEGIFQNQAEVDSHAPFGSYNALGRFKFKDVNEDGVIDNEDRTYIGNPHPDFTSGFVANLQYKGFDLMATLYASVGNDILNLNRRSLDFNLFQKNRGTRRLYESWGSPYLANNADAKMPIAEVNDAVSQLPSSYYVEDGSFLRLQTVQLGYRVPQTWISRVALKEVRAFFMVTNLFTLSGYSGLDPQIQTSDTGLGVDLAEWPTPRRFLFGVNLTL